MRYNKMQMEKWNSPQRIAIYTAMFLYILACLIPCLETKNDVIYGWYCLAFGWLSLLCDFNQFIIWCSNILFLVTLVLQLFRQQYLSLVLSFIIMTLSILMYAKGELILDIEVPIKEFLWGYYMWAGSYFCCIIAALIGVVFGKETKNYHWGL